MLTLQYASAWPSVLYGTNSGSGDIVEYVEGGYAHTIEDNSANAVNRRSYSVNSSVIFGYGLIGQ
jgi:hypothetical protein